MTAARTLLILSPWAERGEGRVLKVQCARCRRVLALPVDEKVGELALSETEIVPMCLKHGVLGASRKRIEMRALDGEDSGNAKLAEAANEMVADVRREVRANSMHARRRGRRDRRA